MREEPLADMGTPSETNPDWVYHGLLEGVPMWRHRYIYVGARKFFGGKRGAALNFKSASQMSSLPDSSALSEPVPAPGVIETPCLELATENTGRVEGVKDTLCHA